MKTDVLVVVVGIALLVVVWVGWGGFVELRTIDDPKSPVACTADAKLCPDGSYVGRTGPNCEFECPGR